VSTALSSVYRLTYEDWLATPDDNVMREIIEGELYVVPPPSTEHQEVSNEIEFQLQLYLRKRRTGRMLHAPTGMRLSDDNVVEPDILVVLNDGAATIEHAAVMGPADLVVEILSRGTAKRDVGPKRRIYETFGVREYWIVDPVGQRIEVLTLQGGAYATHAVHDMGATLASPVLPGFELELRDVFRSRS